MARYAWTFACFVVALAASCLAQDLDSPLCSVTGLDYTSGGNYMIDGTVEEYFAFTSLFKGQFLHESSEKRHSYAIVRMRL
jgi:hypothetical protein